MVVDSCSLNSSSSTSSSRYRTVSKKSKIDESLFGNKQFRFQEQDRNYQQKKSKINRHHHDRSNVVIAANCLTKEEIHGIARRISAESNTSTEQEQETLISSKHQESYKEDDTIIKEQIIKKQKAMARKEHMLNLELEKANQFVLNQSTTKPQLNSTKGNDMTCIDNLCEQSRDILKLLNAYKQRAAAFAIRDQQLKDKASRKKEEEEYDKLKDMEMEICRLKELTTNEKAEEARLKKQMEDRKIIQDQIKERQHQKLLEEEERDQENRKFQEAAKRCEEEEAQKIRRMKEEGKQLILETIRQNEEILKEREAKKIQEQNEDAMILAYIMEQDEKLRQREQEEEYAKKKKIEVQKKLLESHTKILDRKAEMNELSARRAAEENERKQRQKELQEAQKRKNDMKMLQESRRQQELEKRLAKDTEISELQKEYNDAIRHAAEMDKRERDEAETLKQKNADLRKMLQQQIEEKERKAKIFKKEKLLEGKEIKTKMAYEQETLESIRNEMVADMRNEGVNEKYFAEMLTLNIKKMLSN